jgi:Protein of unknown function (DUF2950)
MSKKTERDLYRFLPFVSFIITLALLWTVSWNSNAENLQQKVFSSPDDAVNALIAAAKSENKKQLLEIFGPGSEDLISSGDEQADQIAMQKFVKRTEEMKRINYTDDGQAILSIGNDDWPFPVPIVKDGDKWRFDTAEGMEEILDRRIGKNELSTISVCDSFVSAEREYASTDRNGDGVLEYARKFLSTPGSQDGLYWEAAKDEEESPIGPLMAAATAEGYELTEAHTEPAPFHGYYYRILTSQGPDAPGGKYDYIINGRMVGGFALIAYPAKYGSSGVMTFLVNQNGVIYQKDLGENTDKIAKEITEFNPDKTWQKVD